MSSSNAQTGRQASVRDLLQLIRLPNVFTALADVTMGYLFVQGGLWPFANYVVLGLASLLLYAAGMVLNDLWDIDQDRKERPDRPLASGRISPAAAQRLGFGLLFGGILLGWGAGYLPLTEAALPWRAGVIATLLAFLIVLYDARLKRTPLGPLAMGGCRALNVLLGMSLAVQIPDASLVAGFGMAELVTAGGIGLYIAGVTWFARSEAGSSRRWQLAGAALVMGMGIAWLATVYRELPIERLRTQKRLETWYLLLGLLAFVILRRCAMAIAEPSPHKVQMAVKNAIWSLIMLDAAVALLVAHPAWSLAIVALLLPTMFLGQYLKST